MGPPSPAAPGCKLPVGSPRSPRPCGRPCRASLRQEQDAGVLRPVRPVFAILQRGNGDGTGPAITFVAAFLGAGQTAAPSRSQSKQGAGGRRHMRPCTVSSVEKKPRSPLLADLPLYTVSAECEVARPSMRRRRRAPGLADRLSRKAGICCVFGKQAMAAPCTRFVTLGGVCAATLGFHMPKDWSG